MKSEESKSESHVIFHSLFSIFSEHLIVVKKISRIATNILFIYKKGENGRIFMIMSYICNGNLLSMA